MTISWKGAAAIALLLLPNIFFAILSKENMPQNLKDGGVFFNILEHGSQILYFIFIIIRFKDVKASFTSPLFYAMMACLAVYYLLWVRYFMIGRDYSRLFDTIVHIPLPMALFPVLYLLFAALWFKSPPLTVLTGLFAAGHFVNSYITYQQLH